MASVLLLGHYELGRQPFGLASAAAWLRAAGWPTEIRDLSRQQLAPELVRVASLIGLYLPMHTATRLAAALLPALRRDAPRATLCCFGLYAPLNAEFLRELGASVILGPEFEADLVRVAQGVPPRDPAALPRLPFLVPERAGLPPLADYARLRTPSGARVAGATETTRGCKHFCRHCPIVPVYGGHFRVIPRAVVLEDIRRQVAAGAEHITFADPDFFNGPAHALAVVRALHAEFPRLSYDVTIKIEHLLRHAALLPELRATGCVLVTSAVESLDDAVLARLAKGHTRADFLRAVELLAAHGLALSPTFVPFTPWTTPAAYADLLQTLARLGLVEAVAPIQLGIRLLIPRRSRILDLPDAGEWLGAFEPATLSYRWRHPDPEMDELQRRVQSAIAAGVTRGAARAEIFARLCALAAVPPPERLPPRERIPYLDEPWFC
ncbi:MAG TPA: CUAEP/CCAEP-tail radical SAM protein [Terriglobales bacterium]|nr:CUAEP/CCAEP-tail radical SAM protein [Terriglobales bacterium]